jgi:hypothetical protein
MHILARKGLRETTLMAKLVDFRIWLNPQLPFPLARIGKRAAQEAERIRERKKIRRKDQINKTHLDMWQSPDSRPCLPLG